MKISKKITILFVIIAIYITSFAYASDEYKTYYYSNDMFNSDISLFSNISLPDENEIEFVNHVVSEMIDMNTQIDVTSYNIKINRFSELWNYFISASIQQEHPELFYLSGCQISLEQGIVATILPKYLSTDYIEKAQTQITGELEYIKSLLSDDMSDFEKILVVHDYIVNNYSYDLTYESRTLDSMVLQKTGVCQGYTYLFKYVMDNIGIECVTVPSDENNHIWNKIKINGEWYNIDLTSDDPIYEDSYIPFSTEICRDFFILNDYELISSGNESTSAWNDYKWDGQTPVEVSDSTAYSDSIARQISGNIIPKNGKFYVFSNFDIFTGQNNLAVVDLDNNTITSVYNNSSYFTWKPWGKPLSFYAGQLSSLINFNNELYFNSPNKVYRYDDVTNTAEEVFEYEPETPDISKTYIWGLKVIDNELNIEYSEDINSGVQKYIPIYLDVTPTPTPSTTPENSPTPTMPCSSSIEKEENGSVTITFQIPDDVTEAKYLYTAQYDENGVLIGIAQIDISQNTCNITPEENASSIKAFIMADDFKPLSIATPYQINNTENPDTI